jgi:hypothetical protein
LHLPGGRGALSGIVELFRVFGLIEPTYFQGAFVNIGTPPSLHVTNLIKIVHKAFLKIPDPRVFVREKTIPLIDHLMAGLAIFGLKFPSLLNYDKSRKEPHIEANLKNLYHVDTAPSDTYLRERLDEVDPLNLRPAFKDVFSKIQRNKYLERFAYLDGHYLLSIDGTGEFSSSEICCQHCCKKVSSNGTTTYYHQMLGGCIVHPDQKNVIPLCPELIKNEDGQTKNDCERNAAKRFIGHFRREHPHLKVIVIEDGLSSNAPHIELLNEHDIKYILGAKPGDHEFLFTELEKSLNSQYEEFRDDKGVLHQFHFLNKVGLNKSNKELMVNVLEYRQTTSKGKETNFSWITNITITKENAWAIARGGRARWKIENETFNTLKTLGYNFEHNYGHGKKYLSTNLCLLMVLAFLIDQVQEIACQLFQKAKKKTGTYRSLWEAMRTFFIYIIFDSWESFYRVIAKDQPIPNTS